MFAGFTEIGIVRFASRNRNTQCLLENRPVAGSSPPRCTNTFSTSGSKMLSLTMLAQRGFRVYYS